MKCRLTGPLLALARHSDTRSPYRASYRARVVSQSADWLRVDVQPDDPLLPVMANVYLHHGVPGLRVKLRLRDEPPVFVMVGWLDGSPTKPFAAIWAPTSPSNVEALAFPTQDRLDLGQRDAIDAVIKGTAYREAEQEMNGAPLVGLAATYSAMALLCVGPLLPLKPGFTALAKAITTFEAKSETFLSEIVRTG